MNKEDIYIKGHFSGQYTARKDAAISFSSESYHNISIDSGKIIDFTSITKETWKNIESDRLSQQKFFKKIKCLPKKKHPDFTGYDLQFDDVKITNVKISNITAIEGDKSVGDITCDFFGLIKRERRKREERKVLKPNVYKKTANTKKNY